MTIKKVLITGASRGIGNAIAKRLSNNGYQLILHASRISNLDNLLKQLPSENIAACYEADFAITEATEQFIKKIKKEHKDLFAVVSNAGIAIDKPLIYQPISEIDMMLNINLRTPMLLGKMAMKLFQKNNKGVFIAVASCVGEMGNAFQSIYAATKAGNVAFCKSLAQESGELNPEGNIRFLSISPGFIETEMTSKLNEDIKEAYFKKIPSKRFGTPEDVAKSVRFLLSDEASYINGSEIKINGGIL